MFNCNNIKCKAAEFVSVKNISVSHFSGNNVFYGKNCIMKSKF